MLSSILRNSFVGSTSPRVAAVNAFCWYLSNQTPRHSVAWITRLFREDEWWDLQFDQDGQESEDVPTRPQYLMIGMDKRGIEFATLKLSPAGVICRVGDRTFCLYKGNPYRDSSAITRTKKSRRQKMLGTLQATIDNEKRPPEQQKKPTPPSSLAPMLHSHPATAGLVDNGCVIGKVFINAPFEGVFGAQFGEKERNILLKEWNKVWGKVLGQWLAYYHPRRNKSTGSCHYWLPPGATKFPLRSSKDLYDYLQLAKVPGTSFEKAHEIWKGTHAK